ncbi:MAG: hypothetical protein RDU14_17855 [Melioribacteraceae bacterium]|nr:hypothetical protein [Melioribacteraceae bacterium]
MKDNKKILIRTIVILMLLGSLIRVVALPAVECWASRINDHCWIYCEDKSRYDIDCNSDLGKLLWPNW